MSFRIPAPKGWNNGNTPSKQHQKHDKRLWGMKLIRKNQAEVGQGKNLRLIEVPFSLYEGVSLVSGGGGGN
jgi:hypothetical protein